MQLHVVSAFFIFVISECSACSLLSPKDCPVFLSHRMRRILESILKVPIAEKAWECFQSCGELCGVAVAIRTYISSSLIQILGSNMATNLLVQGKPAGLGVSKCCLY